MLIIKYVGNRSGHQSYRCRDVKGTVSLLNFTRNSNLRESKYVSISFLDITALQRLPPVITQTLLCHAQYFITPTRLKYWWNATIMRWNLKCKCQLSIKRYDGINLPMNRSSFEAGNWVLSRIICSGLYQKCLMCSVGNANSQVCILILGQFYKCCHRLRHDSYRAVWSISLLQFSVWILITWYGIFMEFEVQVKINETAQRHLSHEPFKVWGRLSGIYLQ